FPFLLLRQIYTYSDSMKNVDSHPVYHSFPISPECRWLYSGCPVPIVLYSFPLFTNIRCSRFVNKFFHEHFYTRMIKTLYFWLVILGFLSTQGCLPHEPIYLVKPQSLM